MDFGVHLPLIDFEDDGYSLASLIEYADTARELGYAALSTNDHMLYQRPWLDGLTALSTVLSHTGDMTLMTSVALPVIRGPIPAAKALAAIDLLSGGRLVVGVGPGSSRADYDAAGIDFEERWKRVDDAIEALRALWTQSDYDGAFYSTTGVRLAPRSRNAGCPPIRIGSWGSAAGLRRTARLGDGWLASAYNTTPDDFALAWQQLQGMLPRFGKDAASFQNTLATMWTYVTESKAEAQDLIEGVLSKMLNRSTDDLAINLPIGTAEHCAGVMRRYREAGVQRILLWPLRDAAKQISSFKTSVEPLIG